MYLISQKIEFKFSFQPEFFFFSVKSHFSFLFGVFLAFLVQCPGPEYSADAAARMLTQMSPNNLSHCYPKCLPETETITITCVQKKVFLKKINNIQFFGLIRAGSFKYFLCLLCQISRVLSSIHLKFICPCQILPQEISPL